MPSINIRNLTYGYDSNDPVLHNIDLELVDDGLVCIIGPNGVGKSTLVRCINRLIEPKDADIEVNGKNVADYTLQELSKIMGFVPATTELAFPMSVVDSILIGRDVKKKWRVSNEDVGIVYKSLDVMRMRDLALRLCTELSAGQSQKVSICRGLVRESQILILDEPTANLDIKHQIFMLDFMHKLANKSGMMIVMISHDLNIAARYADKIIVMSKPGVIYDVGTPSEVITEEMIMDVYDVQSDVVEVEGRPHVILKNAINW